MISPWPLSSEQVLIVVVVDWTVVDDVAVASPCVVDLSPARSRWSSPCSPCSDLISWS